MQNNWWIETRYYRDTALPEAPFVADIYSLNPANLVEYLSVLSSGEGESMEAAREFALLLALKDGYMGPFDNIVYERQVDLGSRDSLVMYGNMVNLIDGANEN